MGASVATISVVASVLIAITLQNADLNTSQSTFSVEQLLNSVFPTKVSSDIDLDPCKAGKYEKHYYTRLSV